MFKWLNAAAEFFLRAIAGLLRFFSESATRLGKLLLAASPFLLAIAFALAFGRVAVGVAIALVIVLLALGTGWAISRNEEPRLSLPVVSSILLIDLLLVAGSIMLFKRERAEANRLAAERVETPVEVEKPPHDYRAEKISVFDSELRLALQHGQKHYRRFDLKKLQHILGEIRSMNALGDLPSETLLDPLEYCRQVVDNDLEPRERDTCRSIATEMLKVIGEARNSEACNNLFRLQADGGFLEAQARNASEKACGL